MPDDKITLTGDASQLIKELQKVIAVNDKEIKRLSEVKEASRKTAQAERERARDAKKLTEESLTPLEKYNKKQKELKEHLDKGRISQETFNRSMSRARDEMKGNSKGLSSMSGNLAGYAKGLIGATALLRLFNAELETAERLRQKSRDSSITAEEGLQRARANFVADDTVGKDELDDEVRKSAKRSGVPVAEFATATADALSAKGDRTNRFALSATEAAFAASPNKEVSQAQQLAQSAGDFAKLGGSQQAESIVGFLTQGQQSARITNVAQLGQTAFPSVSASVQNGASIEQGMEQFIALNNLIGDSQGRVSSTASIALTEQLQAFETTTGEGKNKKTSKPLEGMSPTEQIQFLQQNPEVAQQFLEGASFEKKALAGVRSLVTGDERGLAAQGDAQNKIGSLEVAADAKNIGAFNEYKDFVQGKGKLGGELKGAGRKVEQNINSNAAGNTERAVTAQVNELLLQTMENVNLPGLDSTKQYVTKKRTELNNTPEQAIAFARGNLESLVNENQTFRPLGGRLKDGGDRDIVEENLEVLKSIEELLHKTREDQERQAGEQADRDNNNRPPAQNPAGRVPAGRN
jgi:hypothetical protein